LSAGAFSDPEVVKASDGIACIFIECNWGKANTDLSGRYGIGGYPTVLFCDSEGKPIGALDSRDPVEVARQIRDAVQKAGGKGGAAPAPVAEKTVRGLSIDKAPAEARRLGRLILLVFYDDSPASTSVHSALSDDYLKDTLGRFVVALSEYRKGSDDARRFDVSRAPTIFVLNPDLAKLEEKPLAKIEGSRSARELKRDLDSALLLANSEGAGPTRRPGLETPSAEPVEKMSDDEIERKFIKARIAASMELYRKGKKDKAVETLEDVIKSYPKHVETVTARKLLEEFRK
jgi:hypothetical protein